MRVDAWTPEEHQIIRDLYPKGGWGACNKLMPTRSRQSIQREAHYLRVGFKKAQNRYEAKEKTGGPGWYVAPWQPLPPQQRLPVRDGSLAFRDIPSL
jgi:hypothetical protein